MNVGAAFHLTPVFPIWVIHHFVMQVIQLHPLQQERVTSYVNDCPQFIEYLHGICDCIWRHFPGSYVGCNRHRIRRHIQSHISRTYRMNSGQSLTWLVGFIWGKLRTSISKSAVMGESRSRICFVLSSSVLSFLSNTLLELDWSFLWTVCTSLHGNEEKQFLSLSQYPVSIMMSGIRFRVINKLEVIHKEETGIPQFPSGVIDENDK